VEQKREAEEIMIKEKTDEVVKEKTQEIVKVNNQDGFNETHLDKPNDKSVVTRGNKERKVKKRQVVGVFMQIWILMWKNWVLFKRNIKGTLVEILVSYMFVIIIVLLRILIDTTQYYDQTSTTNTVSNVIDQVNTTTGRTYVYYYPNNAFIQGIVTNAMSMIQTEVPAFTYTGDATFFFFLKAVMLFKLFYLF
jgi:hypothetical protein